MDIRTNFGLEDAAETMRLQSHHSSLLVLVGCRIVRGPEQATMADGSDGLRLCQCRHGGYSRRSADLRGCYVAAMAG